MSFEQLCVLVAVLYLLKCTQLPCAYSLLLCMIYLILCLILLIFTHIHIMHVDVCSYKIIYCKYKYLCTLFLMNAPFFHCVFMSICLLMMNQ